MEIRMIINAGKAPQVVIIENARDKFMDKEEEILKAIDELEKLMKSMKKLEMWRNN